MKPQALLWAGGTLYFATVAIVYFAVADDPIGIALLVGATALGGLVAGWIWSTARHESPGPSDRADADHADATGVVGVYPTASLRPLALAAGMSAIALGVVLGSWMTIAGVAITASQVALLVRDADR
jgi:hypothetical protein